MTKDELKPIDVSKYRVTETGQVLKMTNEELAKKADSNHALVSQLADLEAESTELKEDLRNKKLAIKNRNGRIKELEEKISVLLSCKNCPENKGGYICEKEYEGKCLTQKMQYIKELQEENAELKEEVKNNEDLATVAYMQGAESQKKKSEEQLSRAREIIKELLSSCFGYNSKTVNYEVKVKAEKFLKEV